MSLSKTARRKADRSQRVPLIRMLREKYGFGRLIAVAVLALVGGWLAFALAVSGVARVRAPQQALMFVPWDGVAIASNADFTLLTQKKLSPAPLERAGKAALRNQAVSARALRLVAMSAELRGDRPRGEKLTEAAQSMSRRDMVTQFWLIESAIGKNDVEKVIHHYDVALRTNKTAAAMLFPRLQRAIANPDIRGALRPYLQAQVPWTEEFIEATVDGGNNLPALVSLIVENGGLGDSRRERQQQANLLDALFNQKKYADLRRLYSSGPGANPTRLTSAALTAEDQRQMISAAGWQMLNDAEAGGSVTLDRGTRRPVMAVYANAGASRAVARKLLYLAPGTYLLDVRLGPVTRGESGGLSWYLFCVDPPASSPSSQLKNIVRTSTAQMVVPQGCRTQLLEVHAAGGRGQTGLDALVTAISLRRM